MRERGERGSERERGERERERREREREERELRKREREVLTLELYIHMQQHERNTFPSETPGERKHWGVN